MTITIEVDAQTNRNAFRSYEIILAELIQSADTVESHRQLALKRSDLDTAACLALTVLQCAFGVRLLCLRAACYQRCIDSDKYSKEFWLKVTFN